MPFEAIVPNRPTAAVVGAGIAGMSAAEALADTHDVTLFEAESRLGGHARTIVAGKRGDQPVDTGFIVFNYANYPRLSEMFERLDVPVVKSNMSFGASVAGGRIEYGLAGAPAFFAQKKNALNPLYLRMLRDIFRFNAKASDVAEGRNLTIGELIAEMRLGRYFADYYLLPFSGAIWSTPTAQIMDFPANALLSFFRNHGLLGYDGQHQWYTVDGGSTQYVQRLEASMNAKGVKLRLGAPIDAVKRSGAKRSGAGVEVKTHAANWEGFDEIIFATHSDDTLRMLTDASPGEQANLGAIGYQPNDIVLHADKSLMPKRKAVWSSWNYAEAPVSRDGQIDVTYWMNSLQPIPEDDPMFVTLNSRRSIAEELIYDEVTLRHPVFDIAALDAQHRVHAENGTNNTWFCGAWLRHGFHEDGIATALEVVEAIAQRDANRVAAE